jgi:hypothetical protein
MGTLSDTNTVTITTITPILSYPILQYNISYHIILHKRNKPEHYTTLLAVKVEVVEELE